MRLNVGRAFHLKNLVFQTKTYEFLSQQEVKTIFITYTT